VTVLERTEPSGPGGPGGPAGGSGHGAELATRAPVRGQLPQVDVVRVLTFAAVICVHASSMAFLPSSTANGASLMTLHFTREVFFVITGFVLVHSYGRRTFDLGRFYRRRVLLVGLPYLLWSLIYFAVNVPFAADQWLWWRTLGYDLITGRASYQLYFLLVSLQAYLVLPLLLRLLRRTVGRHGRLLAVSLAAQLAITELIQHYVVQVHGAQQVAILHADVYLPTYQLYFLVGALAAWHLPRLQHLVETRGRWVLAALVASAILMQVAYWLQVPRIGAQSAQNVLQPAMVPWSLAVALGLYWLGSRWAAQPRTGRLATVVSTGSRLSFGIYLVHPLVLDLLLDHGFRSGHGQVVPPLLASVVLVLAAVVAATVLVALLQRTPLSAALTGREAAVRWDTRWIAAAVVVVGGFLVWVYATQQAIAPSLAQIAAYVRH
jgi:peptidoglycan/LPS O-acetylase OafA/YrhL